MQLQAPGFADALAAELAKIKVQLEDKKLDEQATRRMLQVVSAVFEGMSTAKADSYGHGTNALHGVRKEIEDLMLCCVNRTGKKE